MNRLPCLVMWVFATALAPALVGAQVRVTRDIDYVPSAEYADRKDRLDLYVPGAYLGALIALDSRYLEAHRLALKDLRAVVPVSAFFYVAREGVAPDRPKDVWGTDAAVWRQASPAAYVRGDASPMLVLYADGDEPWRRQQQVDFVKDLRAAGARSVELRPIAGRSHMSIWWNLKDPKDETAAAIVQYIEQQLKAGTQR